ncbi:hypothetical protein EZV73_22750 [Acidaminobacter sp. JC074]|uniref:tetratricopeptide repeat protein n=1 Tax=Acidaminobacter sp. JC074 TaxID=2530199 RepID=UPI001F0E3460|nr:NB-ARC domain-containing protein [Acidaminobacter sp. JC074]MCH4890420.1 hypothetical protein [Acidaminobacter sp. JC074]
MSLPDFMNESLVKLKRVNDSYTRLEKATKLNMYLIRYLAIISYCSLKSLKIRTTKADEVILNSFHRPTDGIWMNLLRESLSIRNQNEVLVECMKKKLSKEQSERFFSMFSLLIQNKDYNSKELSYLDTLSYILKVKNLKVSHGAFAMDSVDIISKTILETTEEIIVGLEENFNFPMVQVDFDKYDEVYTSDIHGNTEKERFKDFTEDDGLYVLMNNSLLPINPFMICRDGEVVFYDSFEKRSGRVNYSNNSGVCKYIKRETQKISELFEIDVDTLNLQPLYLNLQESVNGTIHNLPSKGYNKFIGRLSELDNLKLKVAHKRNFITALDGIGGVGKSAIALEFCDELINNYEKTVDYVFWVSAKTTILKNGKIESIKQSFVHLEQLLDLILEMTGFSEYKTYEIDEKRIAVTEILELINSLIVLDNLETISENNLKDIWEFINDIPSPNKVLLTSREMHYNAHQELRVTNLSKKDSIEFLNEHCKVLNIEESLYKNFESEISDLSSGLPIAIKSIIGQIVLGRNFKGIKKSILNNTDNLAEFCFKEQLKLLDKDHYKLLLYVCYSIEPLDFDAIEYLVDELNSIQLAGLLDTLISLSIIHIEEIGERRVYSTLPLIKKYIVHTIRNLDLIETVKNSLNDFYNLTDVESFSLYPVEERNIKPADFIPKKIIDKAMKHAQNDDYEEAEIWFKKALNSHEEDEYVLYTYSEYLSKYRNNIQDSINYLKKANSIGPNYFYLKKIGDHHSKLRNYDAAIKYYSSAQSEADSQKDKDEMIYNIAVTTFRKVKRFRKDYTKRSMPNYFEIRNDHYRNITSCLEEYLDVQPRIYPGKKVNVHRMLAEAYFGLKDYENALNNINIAISLSEGDNSHEEYKKIICERAGNS